MKHNGKYYLAEVATKRDWHQLGRFWVEPTDFLVPGPVAQPKWAWQLRKIKDYE